MVIKDAGLGTRTRTATSSSRGRSEQSERVECGWMIEGGGGKRGNEGREGP